MKTLLVLLAIVAFPKPAWSEVIHKAPLDRLELHDQHFPGWQTGLAELVLNDDYSITLSVYGMLKRDCRDGKCFGMVQKKVISLPMTDQTQKECELVLVNSAQTDEIKEIATIRLPLVNPGCEKEPNRFASIEYTTEEPGRDGAATQRFTSRFSNQPSEE